MKFLVTGATGFVGNYVIKELLKYNHEIVATSIEDRVEIKNSWCNNVTYLKADLNERREDWFSYFGEPDMVLHLAWEGLPNYNELYHLERNLMANYFFLKNMIEIGLKKVLISGTCFEYGLRNGMLNENMETLPNTPYALAKDSLRKLIEQLKSKFNFELQWVRIFYMYGDGQSPNSVLSQLKDAINRSDKVFNMSGGEQLRDYLPVEKTAEYIVRIANQNNVNGVINCCSGKPISIRKLIENYLEKENKNIALNLGFYPYPKHEPFAFWGDRTKLESLI